MNESKPQGEGNTCGSTIKHSVGTPPKANSESKNKPLNTNNTEQGTYATTFRKPLHMSTQSSGKIDPSRFTNKNEKGGGK